MSEEQQTSGISGTKVVALLLIAIVALVSLAFYLFHRERARLQRGEPPSIKLNRPQ